MNSLLTKKFNLLKLSSNLASFGFILLFPIFFVYHFFVSQSYLTPFLGGLFGNISLLISIVSVIMLPWFLHYKIKQVRGSIFLFYFSILFFLIWTLCSQFLISNHPHGNHSFLESYSSFIIWIALFYIGYFLLLDDASFLFTLKISCFIIFLIFIYVSLNDKSFFALFKIFQNGEESASLSSYQQAGRSIFISFLFLSMINKNKLLNILLLLICGIILLSIGSRTDLISIFLALLAYCFHIIFKGSISLLNKFLIFLTISFLFLSTIILFKSTFFDSRAAEIFDLASSTSWQGRSDLSDNALVVIKNNPILGKFDYYDSPGGYAHNILSSWTSFGIFGFLLYLFLLIYFFAISIFGYLYKSKFNNLWLLVSILNFISFSQALIAAPIFSALPALGWGLTLNIYLKSKVNFKN